MVRWRGYEGTLLLPTYLSYVGATMFVFHFLFSDSHVSVLLSDGMVDGSVWTGPTDMVDSHQAHRPSVLLFLDLEHAWQSSGRLWRRFQINYLRSSPIIGMRHCVEPAP